mmetsp:Transcript_33289/g.105402  ORF Transcript_33289/g.105402 Transcript_33289/m.105402 type:complete len:474 (+) Transcript_33289:58-1479(+)
MRDDHQRAPPPFSYAAASVVPLHCLRAHALAAMRRERGKLRESLTGKVPRDSHDEQPPAPATGSAVGVGRALQGGGRSHGEAVLHKRRDVHGVPGPEQGTMPPAATLPSEFHWLAAEMVDKAVQATAQGLPWGGAVQHLEVKCLEVRLVARPGQGRQGVGGQPPRCCKTLRMASDHNLLVLLHGADVQVGEPHVQGPREGLQLVGCALCALQKLCKAPGHDFGSDCGRQALRRHALGLEVALQDTPPGEAGIALVTCKGEYTFGADPGELCEGPTDAPSVGDCNDNGLCTSVARGEGVRHKWGYEVAVTRLHLATMHGAMLVLEVEVHGAHKEGRLHHEVPVVKLHVRVQRVATLHQTQLLDPLGSKLAAPAHCRVPVLVIRCPLPGAVRALKDPGRRLSSFRGGKAHPTHRVVGVQPQVVQGHRIHLAHLPENVEGIAHLQIASKQALKLRKVNVELLCNNRQRALQVIRFT